MSESSNAQTQSLYDRIGGREIVREIVERFFERVREDADLKSVYDHPNLAWLKENQVDFLSRALGGPALTAQYEQQEAHADLWKEERYFFTLAAHLRGAMLSIGIAPLRIDEVVATLSPWSTQHEAVASGKSFNGWSNPKPTNEWDGGSGDWFGAGESKAKTATTTPATSDPSTGGDFARDLQATVGQLESLARASHEIESSSRLAGERQRTAQESLRSVADGLTRLDGLREELGEMLERGSTLGRDLHQSALKALLLGLRPDLSGPRMEWSRASEELAQEMENLLRDAEERITSFQAEELMLRGSLDSFRQILKEMHGTEGNLLRDLEERLNDSEALGRSIEGALPR